MSAWLEAAAPAKLNLTLVVGPRRADGKHEVATVLERLSLADTVSVRRGDAPRVEGFEQDTLVRAALDILSREAPDGVSFEARIVKRIPVAAGLGGGSSDAATALRLANGLLERPVTERRLADIAASLGSDVPFFLTDGPQLATGDGTTLAALTVPRDYAVVLALPHGVAKDSTRAMYAAFDERHGEEGFARRRAVLEDVLAMLAGADSLALLPPNDLASSPLAGELRDRGAFRADVTGAGPVVYGLFHEAETAEKAASAVAARAATWVTSPA